MHAIQRGNNRADCFFRDEDRAFYLFHLARLLSRTRCELHAFCLMTNHVHLLLTAKEGSSCSLLMKGVGQLYSQYVNRIYGRTGNLWEGRFKSCLVQSERYVLDCYRYIELNPVRAGLACRADEYPWSSYRTNALGACSPLLMPHAEYLALGRDKAEREAAYRHLFGTAAALDEIRSATNGGYALGDASFKRAVTRTLGRRVQRGRPGRPAKARVPPPLTGELLPE